MYCNVLKESSYFMDFHFGGNFENTRRAFQFEMLIL